MDHATMMMYQKFLLKNGNGKEEINIQKNKKFCDGSMQTYLQYRWSCESIDVKRTIIIINHC